LRRRACIPPKLVHAPDDHRERREGRELDRAEGRGVEDRLKRRQIDNPGGDFEEDSPEQGRDW
jgi:hypothetical protein